MDGVLNLLKPPGMTSHDVVDVVRRAAGLRRVGHTGTLDPGAAGVLVCCLGRATRLSEILMETDKEYRVELRLGIRTSTGDAYGEPLPADPSGGMSQARPPLTRSALEAVLKRFTGEILQVPPMVSAIHHEGARLYQLARRGEAVELQPRSVTVHRIEILWVNRDQSSALLEIACGRGTYIRKLCADIGDALGLGGYAHFMVRTRSGRFQIGEAVTLEELADIAGRGALTEMVMSMDQAVAHLPAVDLPERSVSEVLNGHAIPLWKLGEAALAEDGAAGPAGARLVRLRSRRGTLIALARIDAGMLRPVKVLAGAEGGLVAHRPRPG
jgi:tRNA pseudouridine55 synthase